MIIPVANTHKKSAVYLVVMYHFAMERFLLSQAGKRTPKAKADFIFNNQVAENMQIQRTLIFTYIK